MQRIFLLFFCLAGLQPTEIHAQISNHLLEKRIDLNDSMQESISLSIHDNTFFKNNEYFDDIAQGYTLFGTQLSTELSYIVNKNVRIQAGVYARKDFGNDRFTKVAPLFSIKLQKYGYSALMGTLEGNISHQLAEPIYDYERVILHPIENGLQFKIDHKKLWMDTWINWEVQQYLHSSFQEQLSAGHSSKITLYENEKGLQLKLPLQFLISHKGGQLDLDTTPLKTIANVGAGLVFEFTNHNERKFIKSWKADYFFTYFNNMSPTKTLNYRQGNGTYINLNAVSRYDIGVSLGYWSGKEYLSSRGGYLFQSEASIYGTPGFTQTKRNLAFFRFFYQHKVFDAVGVDIRFEPYYDFNTNYFAYSYSVYFTYKKDLALINLINGKRRRN